MRTQYTTTLTYLTLILMIHPLVNMYYVHHIVRYVDLYSYVAHVQNLRKMELNFLTKLHVDF